MLILELWGAEWNTQQAQIHLIILKLSGPMAVLLSVCILSTLFLIILYF